MGNGTRLAPARDRDELEVGADLAEQPVETDHEGRLPPLSDNWRRVVAERPAHQGFADLLEFVHGPSLPGEASVEPRARGFAGDLTERLRTKNACSSTGIPCDVDGHGGSLARRAAAVRGLVEDRAVLAWIGGRRVDGVDLEARRLEVGGRRLLVLSDHVRDGHLRL